MGGWCFLEGEFGLIHGFQALRDWIRPLRRSHRVLKGQRLAIVKKRVLWMDGICLQHSEPATLEITWNQETMCKTHPTGTSKPPFYASKNTRRMPHFLRLGQDNLLRQWKCLCQPLCRWCSVSPVEVVYETWLSHVGSKRKFPPPLVKYDGNMIHFLQTVIMIDVAIKIKILGIHSIGDPYFQSMCYWFFCLLIWRSLTKLLN